MVQTFHLLVMNEITDRCMSFQGNNWFQKDGMSCCDIRKFAPNGREKGTFFFLLAFAGLSTGVYRNRVLCQEPRELPPEGFTVTF
jgi:hypothetical protein